MENISAREQNRPISTFESGVRAKPSGSRLRQGDVHNSKPTLGVNSSGRGSPNLGIDSVNHSQTHVKGASPRVDHLSPRVNHGDVEEFSKGSSSRRSKSRAASRRGDDEEDEAPFGEIEIECPACTFANPIGSKFCSMCQAKLGE